MRDGRLGSAFVILLATWSHVDLVVEEPDDCLAPAAIREALAREEATRSSTIALLLRASALGSGSDRLVEVEIQRNGRLVQRRSVRLGRLDCKELPRWSANVVRRYLRSFPFRELSPAVDRERLPSMGAPLVLPTWGVMTRPSPIGHRLERRPVDLSFGLGGGSLGWGRFGRVGASVHGAALSMAEDFVVSLRLQGDLALSVGVADGRADIVSIAGGPSAGWRFGELAGFRIVPEVGLLAGARIATGRAFPVNRSAALFLLDARAAIRLEHHTGLFLDGAVEFPFVVPELYATTTGTARRIEQIFAVSLGFSWSAIE